MLIREIHSPDPGARTDIKHAVQSLRFWDRSCVEFARKCQVVDVVLEIEAVIFALIIGEGVCAVLEVC
jgi:hypothetical protein